MSAVPKVDIKAPCKIVMTNEEYHAHSAVGSSSLKHILRSPAHYLAYTKEDHAPTRAMELGTAIHQAILEPNLFKDNAIVKPKFSGKGARDAEDQWLMSHADKLILKQDDMDIVDGILNSITHHALVSKLLAHGAAEESYFWIDEETGILCKCRPDYLREGHIIVDVKSTIDASPDGFPTQIARMKYHVSAAYYLDGVSAVIGQKFDDFLALAIEKESPYAMCVHRLDSGAIDAGRMLYKKALKSLARCRETNHYPAYAEKIVTSSLPSWAFPFEEVE